MLNRHMKETYESKENLGKFINRHLNIEINKQLAKIESENFIDKVVERIQKKQL